MPAQELKVKNRTCYFRKAITAPDINTERVLARDAFRFALLWLKRNHKGALPYWEQARDYYSASRILPPESSPLTSYYCFLNAIKALLIVKEVSFIDRHGVAGSFSSSKRALANETIHFKGSGVLSALSGHLREPSTPNECNLKDALANLPFIHRAFRHTYRSDGELFIPVSNVVYRKHPFENRIWLSCKITGRYADGRTLNSLPTGLEKDNGFSPDCIVRTTKRIKWHAHNATNDAKASAVGRLRRFHQEWRRRFVYISSSPDLWYIKRGASARIINRYQITIIAAAMHRLSELSRYDPEGLKRYLDGKDNWLLTEFIELSPAQFIDELVCEMTGMDFSTPGLRPLSV